MKRSVHYCTPGVNYSKVQDVYITVAVEMCPADECCTLGGDCVLQDQEESARPVTDTLFVTLTDSHNIERPLVGNVALPTRWELKYWQFPAQDTSTSAT